MRSSGTRGINKRSLRGTKRIGLLDLNVVAEYTFRQRSKRRYIKKYDL